MDLDSRTAMIEVAPQASECARQRAAIGAGVGTAGYAACTTTETLGVAEAVAEVKLGLASTAQGP